MLPNKFFIEVIPHKEKTPLYIEIMDISEIEKNLLKIQAIVNTLETQLDYLVEYINTDNLTPRSHTEELFNVLKLVNPTKEEFLSTFNSYLVTEKLVSSNLIITLNPLLQKTTGLQGQIIYSELIKILL